MLRCTSQHLRAMCSQTRQCCRQDLHCPQHYREQHHHLSSTVLSVASTSLPVPTYGHSIFSHLCEALLGFHTSFLPQQRPPQLAASLADVGFVPQKRQGVAIDGAQHAAAGRMLAESGNTFQCAGSSSTALNGDKFTQSSTSALACTFSGMAPQARPHEGEVDATAAQHRTHTERGCRWSGAPLPPSGRLRAACIEAAILCFN